MSKSRIYNVWNSMLSRCNNENVAAFKDYGGRGISVCERWLKFENFLEDMGDPPLGMTIDRINNDGNYEKSNCRWISQTEQSRNTRKNKFLTYNGKTQVLADWARELGIGHTTILLRIKRGWSVEKALSTPVFYRGQDKRKPTN